MIIRSAEFVLSAARASQYPPGELPEVAFAGRSNVGKSSLINTLLNRKKLALTSATPGKTRLINFFRINASFMLVDLPGYGYAKVSAAERRGWAPMIERYLAGRACLKAVVALFDIRRDPGPEDVELVAWLARRGIPLIPVATKSDKLAKSAQARRLAAIAAAAGTAPGGVILFSSKSRLGREALWRAIGGFIGIKEQRG
jgi:GTP-binding protein